MTQIRRVIRPQPTAQLYSVNGGPEWAYPDPRDPDVPDWGRVFLCPFGGVGDRLYVKETWILWGPPERQYVDYRATCPDADQAGPWKPSVHMSRALSRITLEIESVRVERLQDMKLADLAREGFPKLQREQTFDGACERFITAWDAVNAKRGYPWEGNPYVWCVSFRRVGP